MFLSPYFSKHGDSIKISANQASNFAKSVAFDFNPIHDADAKRFCVPGDLLFALVLTQCGVKQQMHFNFEGMVGKDVLLKLPNAPQSPFSVQDDAGKTYLTVHQTGDGIDNMTAIEHLITAYVTFSGHNFVDVLLPLMKDNGVMINPKRPLVMYQSMSFEIQQTEFSQVHLEIDNQQLTHNGKRGEVVIDFNLVEGKRIIGTGKKTSVLSGLQPYDQIAIDELTTAYENRKQMVI